MFSYYEGVLHSIGEGLVLQDRSNAVVLYNDRAAELLGLPRRPATDTAAVPLAQLDLPPAVADVLARTDAAVDEIAITPTHVLVIDRDVIVSRERSRGGGRIGTVTTLRDHTELQELTGELETMTTLSDALRSQAHEFANRLHTIIALIELDRPADAAALASSELALSQALADRLLSAVEEPVLLALLLGKAAQASERGIAFEIDLPDRLEPTSVPARDLITIVGNLIDNALDAAARHVGARGPRRGRGDGCRAAHRSGRQRRGPARGRPRLRPRRHHEGGDRPRHRARPRAADGDPPRRQHPGAGLDVRGDAAARRRDDPPRSRPPLRPPPSTPTRVKALRMPEALRVLVVEDEPVTAEAHAAYVGRVDGFDVAGIAHTGHEAIRMLRDAREGRIAPIDLILLDVNLPDTTGIELCRSLRAAGIEIDVIAVTAVRDAAVVRSAVSLGIVQYLIKPFGFAAFAEKLNAYRDYHARVGTAAITDQQEVDASFAALRTSSGGDLPKGLTRETLDRVRAAVREAPSGAVSATELAAALDLSRVTARRYLEHLADTGVVERASRYGTPGRPEVEYRRADRPASLGIAPGVRPDVATAAAAPLEASRASTPRPARRVRSNRTRATR